MTGTQKDRETCRETEKHVYRETDKKNILHTIHTEKKKGGKQTTRDKDRESERQIDSETERHRDTEKKRHRDTETQRHRDTKQRETQRQC